MYMVGLATNAFLEGFLNAKRINIQQHLDKQKLVDILINYPPQFPIHTIVVSGSCTYCRSINNTKGNCRNCGAPQTN